MARLFKAQAGIAANYSEELYPGYTGLVIADGEVRAMNWGFPVRLRSMKPGSKPKPVTNARDDKLYTAFWRDSFMHRRCLIPVTQWAEPQGPSGRMTKTWYSLPGIEVFAVAGLWRNTDEWGHCYTMVMTDSSPQMAEVHDRMPVILKPDDYERWQRGTDAEAFGLVQTWGGELLVDATDRPWSQRG